MYDPPPKIKRNFLQACFVAEDCVQIAYLIHIMYLFQVAYILHIMSLIQIMYLVQIMCPVQIMYLV